MTEDHGEDFVEVSFDLVKSKILHVLAIYPKLSPSMLQVGIGTALPPKIWRPVLDRLVREGKVKVEEYNYSSPSGRDQTYQIVSLVV